MKKHAPDVVGNLFVLIGALWTAIGVRLSQKESDELWAVETGQQSIDQAKLARLLRLASTYASNGIALVIIGIGTLMWGPLTHWIMAAPKT